MPKLTKDTILFIEAGGDRTELRQLGVYIVDKTFNPLVQRDAWLGAFPEQKGKSCFNESQFITFLISRNLIRKVPNATLNLGDTSAEEMWFTGRNQE